ncbi:MAG: alpha-glucan phosphorylase [Chloroflexi bacterium RBG_16_56_11]|nr:MAG: alpha-glucan phosphorylase [Chloroflexi bacterium RBG_16_56_11]
MTLRSAIVTNSKIPQRIERLQELASSLWWSWHPLGRAVFRTLDYPLWRLSGHNPVRQLYEISREKLETAAGDAAFVSLFDSALTAYDKEIHDATSWYSQVHAGALPGPIAYFSMEFAIHNSLPIYAGGLGVLAGDLLKEASDLGIPMVAVGFMYPQGYFRQRISAEGWQEEEYQQLDFSRAPVNPIVSSKGDKCLAEVHLKNRVLHVGAWLVKVGRVSLYLLDTSLEENLPQDRLLSNRLYTADREQRLQQEILLGIGGVRVLRSLGIQPSVWHANEGHTAFMMVERVREEISRGTPSAKALEKVRKTSVFTTHTPVPAGHDVFTSQLMEQYFEPYWPSLTLNKDSFLDLGRYTGSSDGGFNMTILSLKTSGQSNAVSELHGKVSRRMWYGLWPNCNEENCPILHITNGIHVPTWIAIEIRELFEKYLGPTWLDHHDNIAAWKKIDDIPDEEIWRTHQILKRKLFHIVLEKAQQRWARDEGTPQQILAMGSLLDHDALTIAFVRRFAEYKRPSLLFYDVERLKNIINNSFRPVQIIFAGKSHPADTASKMLLQRVHTTARDRTFQGRIAFLEDYDMRLARYLVQGVDIWLNTPRRLQEASGTSGMKACLNGVLHLSVPDGWWHEAYNDGNGWSVGDETIKISTEEEDRTDANTLYHLLEEKVIPLYYNRDRRGIPQEWVGMMKKSIRTVSPIFSARRMLKEYCDKLYLPAVRS